MNTTSSKIPSGTDPVESIKRPAEQPRQIGLLAGKVKVSFSNDFTTTDEELASDSAILEGKNIRQIANDEKLLALHNKNAGYIYNDYRGATERGASGNVLHHAGCRHIENSNTKYPKFFFARFDEAIDWLKNNRGQEGTGWRRCACCSEEFPVSANNLNSESVIGVPVLVPILVPTTCPSLSTDNSMSEAEKPFAESLVEEFLVTWLQSRDYKVKKRVRVSNGIIDLVATHSGMEWVVEVKGEDRGNFNTAEMNFRVGVTQLCSRISTRENREYALAIPLTPKFRKVLIKQEQFEIFQQMRLWLFVVSPDGTVSKIPPDDVQAFRNSIVEHNNKQ